MQTKSDNSTKIVPQFSPENMSSNDPLKPEENYLIVKNIPKI